MFLGLKKNIYSVLCVYVWCVYSDEEDFFLG